MNRRKSIGVLVTPENLASLQRQAAADGVALTWYLLSKLGLSPEDGENGRQRDPRGSEPPLALARSSIQLPLKLTDDETARFIARVAASGKTRSVYVHMKLGIEARDRGRPGHR